jgi:hypothetical protein
VYNATIDLNIITTVDSAYVQYNIRDALNVLQTHFGNPTGYAEQLAAVEDVNCKPQAWPFLRLFTID